MLSTLTARFSRNNDTAELVDSESLAPAHRYDVVEFGRVIFSTDSERDATVAVRFHFIGAHVVDTLA